LLDYIGPVKLAYEHDVTQSQGASYLPKNVVREEHTSSGLSSAVPPRGAFEEQRGEAYRSGVDAARHHFGVKRSSLTQPGTPETNALVEALRKPNPDKFPDAGTGYATRGAQYGANTRK
jgi:hypothetical protein